jgi:hypothetical protein
MAVILNGMCGLHVLSLAGQGNNPDLENVPTQLHSTEVFHVQVMQLKQLIVIQIIVQLMEDILNGVNGLHAHLPAEEEINQDLENVPTHRLNTEVLHVQVMQLKHLIVIRIIVQLMEDILNGVSGLCAMSLAEEESNPDLETVLTHLLNTEVFHV